MSENTTPAAREEQQTAHRQHRAKQEKDVAFLLESLSAHVHATAELAYRLEQLEAAPFRVLSHYGADGLTWEEFTIDLIAWQYMLGRMEDVLRTNFTAEWKEGLFQSGMRQDDEDDDEDEDDGEGDEDDEGDDEPDGPALAVVSADAELPAHRGTPYWLA